MTIHRSCKILVLAAVLAVWGADPLGSVWAKEEDHGAHVEESDEVHHEQNEHRDDGAEMHDGGRAGEEDTHEEHGEEEHRGGGGHEGEDVVRLRGDELQEFGVEVATAGQGHLGLTLKVPGRVVMPTDRIAHVVPRVRGYAREIWVGLGDRVKEGQVMAMLDSPELGETKVEYLSALQELHMAENDWERARVVHDSVGKLLAMLDRSPDLETLAAVNGAQAGEYRSVLISAYSEMTFAGGTYRREKGLHEKKITSGEEFLAAENDYKKAQAEYASARDQVAFDVKTALLEAERTADVAELALRSAERRLHVLGIDETAVAKLAAGKEPEEELARYAIRAPFGGVVIEQHISRGEVLGDDSDAYVVADLETVWVDLSVFPQNVNQMRAGMEAIISAGEGLSTAGKVTYVSPVVDEATRAGLARVSVPNPDGAWKPGMFVDGELVVAEALVSVLVPQTALQNLDGRTVVFVRDGNAFEPRPVTIGRSNELHAEITAGLHAGDEYVSVGAFALKAHLGKANLGDGHNH